MGSDDEAAAITAGVVEHLHIAREARAPMQAVTAARLVAGRGVLGDRYEAGAGTFSNWPQDHEFTLIEAEASERALREYGVALAPGETRRNVTTRGVALNEWVGKRFRIGDTVICEGTRLCPPCAHLEVVTGRGGLCRVLDNRGGLRARIVTGGVIRIGDAVTVLGDAAANK